MTRKEQRPGDSTDVGTAHDNTGLRERILVAATGLLAQGGEGLTTRAVAAAAGIQAPTLYRLFGDKSSLMDAVAEHGFLTYLKTKQVRVSGPDPVENLRAGWDMHVDFGLNNPALFALMSGTVRSGVPSPAAVAGAMHLKRQINALAVSGRLRLSEKRATDLISAAGRGMVLTLLELPENRRDLGLSEIAREAVIAAIVMDLPLTSSVGVAEAAITLRARLSGDQVLTVGERVLLTEWLDRLAVTPEGRESMT
jgi:AcrR family transcriptional regulator